MRKSVLSRVPSQHLPSSENRAVVARELEAFLNRRADKTKDVPDGEIELAVDEAVDHLRAQPRMRIVLDTNILERALKPEVLLGNFFK